MPWRRWSNSAPRCTPIPPGARPTAQVSMNSNGACVLEVAIRLTTKAQRTQRGHKGLEEQSNEFSVTSVLFVDSFLRSVRRCSCVLTKSFVPPLCPLCLCGESDCGLAELGSLALSTKQ